MLDISKKAKDYSGIIEQEKMVADPLFEYMDRGQLEKMADKLKKDMEVAAKDMDFILAAKLRDEYFLVLEKIQK